MSKQITGNVGMYYVCFRLSQLGWNVMPTARNARGIDVIAYREETMRFAGIQVKSLSKRDAVPLGKSDTNLQGDYWVIVSEVGLDHPSAYVLRPCEIEERRKVNSDGSCWLSFRDYAVEEFREKWERIVPN
jgi:hypothetical protein